jgi:glutamate-1-semialdehyde 2,1-aminomutase
MELGGIRHDRRKVFLLSATHGAETHALAAALATMRELRSGDLVSRLWQTGRALQDGFTALAREHGLADHLRLEGYPCMQYLSARDHDGRPSMGYRTLFLQELIAGGVLLPWVAVSASHGAAELDQTLEASRRAMRVYTRALEQKSVGSLLTGPAVKPVFRPYN